MFKKSRLVKSLIPIGIIIILFGTAFSSANILNRDHRCTSPQKYTNLADYTKEIYEVQTIDGATITLTRYVGSKRPSIMLVHGMSVNHKIFDWDDNHSLARSLNNDSWDVWMLDLRTHDGDGDLLFGKLIGRDSDREYINRYWDFDRTLLKKDVVAAIEFIKEKSGNNTIFFMGHSYGGYLAYAYAELIGEENLSGIITTGASAMGIKYSYSDRSKYGFRIGKRAFVKPLGKRIVHSLNPYIPDFLFKILVKKMNFSGIFYDNTTPSYIKQEFRYVRDDEPAGVVVDMVFGKDPILYSGHWLDPQTLYDYTANLNRITVPFLAIAGDQDTDDPMDDVLRTYENVSSINKKFLHFPEHGHLDLLLGDNCSTIIFPEITNWLNSLTIDN